MDAKKNKEQTAVVFIKRVSFQKRFKKKVILSVKLRIKTSVIGKFMYILIYENHP